MEFSDEDELSSELSKSTKPVHVKNRQGPLVAYLGTPVSAEKIEYSLMHKSRKYENEGEQDAARWLSHKSQVIVFTYSGKPVYTRYGSEELIAGFTGTLQALMSKVAVLGLTEGGDDRLKSIKMGASNILYLDRTPLILVSICKVASFQSNIRLLKAVHAQLIFILTGGINRTLLERPGFDVRSLLGGTKPLLCNLISWMHRDMFLAIEDCAIEPLPLPYICRQKWISLLETHSLESSILSFFLSGHRLIAASTRMAPLVSASDMVLLINLVISSPSFRSGESWTPVCLPSVSTDAFVYAYVQFLTPEIAYISLSQSSETFYQISSECRMIQDTVLDEELFSEVLTWTLKCPLAIEPTTPILSHVIHCGIVLKSSGQFFSSKAFRNIKEIFRNYTKCLLSAPSSSGSKQISMTTESGEFVFVWITSEFQFFLTAPRGIDISIITFVYQWIRDNEQTLFLPNIASSESGTRLNVLAPSLW